MLKKKICAGFDGNPHEDYIYKNINGKKYCKSCTYKLQPPKTIPKQTEKQKLKMKIKMKLVASDIDFYLDIWYARFGRVEGSAERLNLPLDNTEILPRCECCQERIFFQPYITFFHHILEKSVYPQYRHLPENIAIVCTDCHNSYHSNPDTIPYLVEKKKQLLLDFEIFKNI